MCVCTLLLERRDDLVQPRVTVVISRAYFVCVCVVLLKMEGLSSNEELVGV